MRKATVKTHRTTGVMMRLFFFIILCTTLSSCGKPITEKKEPAQDKYLTILSGVSEELLFDTKMSLNFHLLPLEGSVRKKETLWSGDPWRLNRGAINYRWNDLEKVGFNYTSPSSREVISSSVERLKRLSPSEKYDILMGRYDYPLKMEVDWMARNGKMDWEGLCHGWAGASLNHRDPEPVILKNPDGIEVPFGSSDIKALLTYAYAKIYIRPEESIGKRCEYYSFNEEDYCNDDLSPVTFHAVLTNKVGLRGQSFIADMDRFKEVWNHPVLSYVSKVTSRRKDIVVVSTKITYVDVIEKNSWERDVKRMKSFLTVKYELVLDKNGNMINGKWLSYERPDFLWTVSEPLQFDGYLEGVKKLIP